MSGISAISPNGATSENYENNKPISNKTGNNHSTGDIRDPSDSDSMQKNDDSLSSTKSQDETLLEIIKTLFSALMNMNSDGAKTTTTPNNAQPSVAVSKPTSTTNVEQNSSVIASTQARGGVSDAAASANPEVGKWNNEIAAASQATGLDPNMIGAQIWAESRGNMNTETSNVDGTKDIGLMQIGQERWNRDIAPRLSAEDKAKIQMATGKDAKELNVRNPLDNLVAGSFHIRNCIDHQGGNVDKGLRFYNTGNAEGAGSSGYVNNVKEYMRELQVGEKLKQDPYNGQNGTGQPGQN